MIKVQKVCSFHIYIKVRNAKRKFSLDNLYKNADSQAATEVSRPCHCDANGPKFESQTLLPFVKILDLVQVVEGSEKTKSEACDRGLPYGGFTDNNRSQF